MPHPWLTPNQADAWAKVLGLIATLVGAVTGAYVWVRDYRRRLAEERVRRETALVDEFLKKQKEVYLQGRRDEQEGLLAIRQAVEGLDAWKDIHSISDTEQFERLRAGQQHTLEQLGEIKSALVDMNRSMQAIRDTARDAAADASRLRRKEQ